MSSSCRLLVFSRYAELGASSRLRMFQYLPYLTLMGIDVVVEPFFDNAYLRNFFAHGKRRFSDMRRAYVNRIRSVAKIRHATVIWIEKELFPYLPGFFETVPRLLGIPYIVDYDDSIFHTYDHSSNAMVRLLLSNRLDSLLRGAYAVTVGNEYLETYARSHGAKNVIRVPTIVSPDRYPVLPMPTGEEIRIGWIGQPVTTKYLEILKEPLRIVAQQHKLKLVTIGASPIDDYCVPVEQLEWSADVEAELLGGVHVGVMPLVDDLWGRGKCGYKLIQYMAAGRPVVASAIGVNREIVTSDVGCLATSEEDWVNSLSYLSSNADVRAKMGAAARIRVERHYSLQATAPKLYELFRNASLRPSNSDDFSPN